MNASEPAKNLDSNRVSRLHLFGAFAVGGMVLIAVLGAVGYLLSKRTTPGTRLVYELDDRSLATEIVAPLSRRLNRIGNVRVRVKVIESGQIEVIVPSRDPTTVELIKGLIRATGVMRFLVLANPADHGALIDRAIEQANEADTASLREVRGRLK